MTITLGAATKLLDNMMVNYSEWHTERAPQGKKVNSVEETSSLRYKIDVIMSILVNGKAHIDPNHVPLAYLVAQEEQVDVNFIRNNNFSNNAYRNNNFSAMNMAFTKHITDALIKIKEEKLKHKASIPRKL